MLDIVTQVSLRRRARQLVKRFGIHVVHQPTPVSPKSPSLLFGLGAPVVIGPMNGGIDFPTGFRDKQFLFQRVAVGAAHAAAQLANVFFPGKRLARRLLVANRRTAAALPAWRTAQVIEIFENGVDLRRWQGLANERTSECGPIRFVNMGRLVDIKVVDLLLEAFARLELDPPPQLDVLGDGPDYVALKQQAADLGIADRVILHGFVPMAETPAILAQADVMVHPSLCEAGGAAVMEGMALGLPVIAADWGGPADYITPDCGVLIAPRDRASYVADLAEAMTRLATSPTLRKRLGAAARQRAHDVFSWSAKIDRMLEIYDDCRREHVSANPRL
jgi:glycosyltransferase involved in cell wall biosynthesis